MLYAIVDIETTGSYAAGSGITEICIVTHDGEQILDTYCTLVNPQRPIPRFIQGLTGITEDMVDGAPTFSEIAAQVNEQLQGKIFIAHNVNFDYSFVKHHLERWGYNLDARKLCTVRLARKITPGLPSYSLGRLCHSLGVEHANAHRAGGDATATAHLFSLLISRDEEGHISQMLKGRNKESYLPPAVPVEQVESLPASPGVYYFYNAAGKVVYVGKAANLHQRVKSHFANNKPGKQKAEFLRDIHRISYTPVATDLMAHILESVEIRKLWPVHNRSQRGYHAQFGLFVYEDQQGYKRLAVEKAKQHFKPLYTFNTLTEGHRWLRSLIEESGSVHAFVTWLRTPIAVMVRLLTPARLWLLPVSQVARPSFL
jgi:DNA polymerase-3 subunit epsilon